MEDPKVALTGVQRRLDLTQMSMSDGVHTTGNLPVESGIAGLTTQALMAITLRQAWELCGENHEPFAEMVGAVAQNCLQYRGLRLPDSEGDRRRIVAAITPLLENEGDRMFAFVVDRAVVAVAAGLTPLALGPMTLRQARELCAEDYKKFAVMVGAVAQSCAKDRGLDLPDSEESRLRIVAAITPLLKDDGDLMFDFVVDKAVVATAAGLTPQALISMTLRQAWELCGEDHESFAEMVGAIAKSCVLYRGLDLPDSEEDRRRIVAAITPLLKNEGGELLAFVVDKAVLATADFAAYSSERVQMNVVSKFDAANGVPSDSGIAGLTVDQLVSLTVHEARAMCGDDDGAFLVMINTVALNVAKHRRMDLPETDLARLRLGEAIVPLLAGDGDQRFAAAVKGALMAALHHAPIPAETIAAYNAVRTCNDKRTVCHAPTTSMYFGRDGFVTACCYSRVNPLGHWPSQSVTEVWFGDKIKKMRGELQRNILPMGCETCADQLFAHNFKGLLAGNFDSEVVAPADGPLTKFASIFRKPKQEPYPTQMEFELSNKCNLECAMCSGLFSSSIRANRENKAPLPQIYNSEFVEQLKEFIPHLKQAKFLGGEPFLIDIYYEIWELFIQSNPSCQIVITTNGSVFTNKVQRVLEHLNCQIVVSLDSVQKATYESIRVNATMERTLDHVEKFMALNRQRSKPLSIAVCPIQKNWREIPGIVDFANSRGIAMFFNTVTFPQTESLKFLPVAELNQVLDVFRGALRPAANPIETRNFRALNDLCQQVAMWAIEAKTYESSLLRVL
jgi:MoaA/NifB/PqqE/SkfB family radical SAM enzyme